MPRPPRIEFPGAIHHVTSRGVARRALFRDDPDRRRFLRLLEVEVERRGWRCHAYCLMTNHVHLLLETPEPNLGGGMQRLKGDYAQWFNHRHDRVGHLFQGRYHARIVQRDTHFREALRYIALNPVRAGLAEAADRWPWSSHRSMAGRAAAPSWLTTRRVLELFRADRPDPGAAYRDFVERDAPPRDPGSEALRHWTVAVVLQSVAREYEVPLSEVTGAPTAEMLAITTDLLHRWAHLRFRDVGLLMGKSGSQMSRIAFHFRQGAAATASQSRLLQEFGIPGCTSGV